MIRRLLTAAWFLAVWVALWESLSPPVVLGGVVLAVGLLVAYPLRPFAVEEGQVVRPLRFLRFVVVCAAELVLANIAVTRAVLSPRHRLVEEGIVAVPLVSDSQLSVTLLSFIVSLTPGTLILEIDRGPAVLYVHFLQVPSITRVRLDIARLEAVLLEAIAGEETIRAAREHVESLRTALAEGAAS
ncbi:MAG TPA: Na+/H+ antiporter subunit E [Egibacteraceae bacterium]